jgi:hypothetical protein
MKTEQAASTADAATYRSGVAARLAGIPVETLRVWERRYGVVGPRVSPRGQRLYSGEEVRRLALIKQLVDMGHPIGAIAALATDALLAMRGLASTLAAPIEAASGNPTQQARIALIGPLISARRFEESLSPATWTVAGRCVDVADAAAALRDTRADIVVLELATLNDASIDTVANIKTACRASQAIVLYRFAPGAVIRRMRAAGNEVARAPSDAIEIESLCRAVLQLPRPLGVAGGISQLPPTPRFDERALSALAGASNTVYCECPRHLVELVLSLGSFERYSAECVNRTPSDAALHRDLQQTAGHARALLEAALLRVAIAEGLPLPPGAQANA